MGGDAFRGGRRVLTSEDSNSLSFSFSRRNLVMVARSLKPSLKSRAASIPQARGWSTLLTYLEEVSHVISTAEGTKKLMSIAEEGKAHLDQHREQAETVLDNLARYGQRMAHFQRSKCLKNMKPKKNGAVLSKISKRRNGAKWRWSFMKLKRPKNGHLRKTRVSLEEKRRVLDVLRRAIKEIRGK